MSGSYGNAVRLTIFGESHGPAIGAVLDGLPPGLLLDEAFIRREMTRRAPGRSVLATPRKEMDIPVIQSGVYEGRTTGTPLCAAIPNGNTRSADYEEMKTRMRPGHGDYTGYIRYRGFQDPRGGGHFSGRLTAPLVFAGAIAKLWLKEQGVEVWGHIRQIGQAADRAFVSTGEVREILEGLAAAEIPVLEPGADEAMREEILLAKKEKDSVGGAVEIMVTGLPPGLGSPFFDSVESRLSHMLFSVPAVKGVAFGSGFALAAMRGSEANDGFYMCGDKVRTKTNHNGGILGGITTGMPLVFQAAVKPTPSIGKPQATIDICRKTDTVLTAEGRHDPCIVPRAVPVLEAAAAWVIFDMMMEQGWGR